MTSEDRTAGPRDAGARSERLAAELKANLKKRKEQARARSRAGGAKPSAAPPGDDTSGT